jgi:predicted TPR repeat methyltransferase
MILVLLLELIIMIILNAESGLFEQGNAYYANNELTKAKESYESAKQIADNADVRCNLASVLMDLGDEEGAEEEYMAALELSPSHSSALFNLAMLLQDSHRYAESIILYQRLIEIDSNSHDTWANLGAALHQQGIQFKKAVDAYKRSATLIQANTAALVDSGIEPKNILGILYENIGRALIRLADQEDENREERSTIRSEAVQAFTTALELIPDLPISRHMLSALGHGSQQKQTAPAEYVSQLFDNYATNFEESLAQLDYAVPSLISSKVSDSQQQYGLALDLGCGTGLLAEMLETTADVLLGVDLSLGMLEKAEMKGYYHGLYLGDLTMWLDAIKKTFDISENIVHVDVDGNEMDMRIERGRRKFTGSIIRSIDDDAVDGIQSPILMDRLADRPLKDILVVAADVFVYIGDLSPIFDVVQGLFIGRSDSTLIFTVEHLEKQLETQNINIKSESESDWFLQESGRFAHSEDYIRKLASESGLFIDSLEYIVPRKENGKSIYGLLCCLSPLSD